MGNENTTLPFIRWREKVKDSENNYNRQKIRRDLKVELDVLNSETDIPSENSPSRNPDASL